MTNCVKEINHHLQQLRSKDNLVQSESNAQQEQISISIELLHELRANRIELEVQNEELRRSYLALENLKAHYSGLYDSAPVAYLTLTREGIITEINLTACEMLGMERNKIINRRFVRFVIDEYKETWFRKCSNALFNKDKISFELPLHDANGVPFYAHINCVCRDNAGESPTLIIAITDISEKNKAEQELRVAAAAFETQDGIIVMDSNKVILRINQAFTHITGYGNEEAIGQTTTFLHSNKLDDSFYYDIWASVEVDGHWQGDVWGKRKNGGQFPAWLSLTAIMSSNGNITHYVASFTDITPQKEAERILLEARQHLEVQVATTNEELEKIKAETNEINTALNVLIKSHHSKNSDAQAALTQQVEETIVPFLKKLKGASTGRTQTTRLIGILENNVLNMVKAYGGINLTNVYRLLTPVEKQVASMIRQGMRTKVIAATLNCSPETIGVHRKNIRKKLGLKNNASSLSVYLQSLAEKDHLTN